MATARFTAILALALAGCMVGPNFHPPPPPTVSGYTPTPPPAQTASANGPGGEAQRFRAGGDISGQWWTLFRSPALNALVERALQANPDLQSAQAALRVAREAYYAQRGAFWPTVGASYNVIREQTSGTAAPPLTSNNDLFTLHTAQVSVSYTPDVFGGIRRQTESVRAQAQAQRFQTEAAYLTLTSSVVVAAIQEAALREELATTRANIVEGRGVLDLLRRQFAAGEISRADVAAQETAVAQSEQSLPPLEKQLAQQEDLIADLTGRLPSEATAERLDLSTLTLPRDLPLSLPARLVEQRPDVRAAEANLNVASALVGVAIANRLPNFALAANAGGQATSISQLFASGNQFWSIGGTIAQPIFEGGALLHRQRGAQAAFDQAKTQYRSIVLSAFQNVADTLQALEADARLLQAADAAERTAYLSVAIAKKQFALGQVAAMVVLNAEQAHEQARIARVQAQAARYADTAALFQALGGGWWNRTETSDVR